jgi:NTE family protein
VVFHFLRRDGQGGDDAVGADEVPMSQRPTVGLVLGGGAARGFAHVGVIRTLVARGFTPDIITGTSIGAVIGGCYAAGKLDEFEEWGKSLTRRRILGYLDVSFSGSGLIAGGRLSDKLVAAVGEATIESLPLRYAAIATEIGTGHEIWITRGKLVDAMRASYALPGVFPPVSVSGRWLMDGALVNPLPISVARALGARVVIAVNVNADNFGRGTAIPDLGPVAEGPIAETAAQSIFGGSVKSAKRRFLGTAERPGISTVMVEAFNVMQDRITRARLAGDPPDVLINPKLARVGVFEFHRAQEAIALGAEAAERAIESISESADALR